MPTAVNPTAGGGARTPHATPDATRTALREARRQNALRLERIRESRLAVIEHRESRRRQLTESLSIDWVTPYAELLDLTRRTGDPVIAGPTAAWQRRQGKNWPIYQTEQELNLLRAPARVLFGTNGYAQGLVEGIKSYVLGTGNTYRVAKEDDQDDLPDDAVDAAQNVVDKFLLRTQWFGGELPGIEEELLERSMVDGEFVLCHYPREDGTTDVRTQEPEMLTQPPGGDWREWSFGVRTPYDDAQDQQAFWIQHGDSPEEGEEYSPDEVTFFRRNVTRAMKRGVTDFCFDTYDALYLAGRLRTNLGDTAAQQAAIVAVRQHDSGTKEDIQSFIDADATLTQTEPITGTQLAQKIHRRGSWEDIPKGMNYAPGPIATSTPIHLQVLDACLRGAGQKWQAPPWLMSGDLNAMNYATSLTAESPFVRTVQRRQRSYCEAFRRPVWFALRHWVRTNGLRDRTGRVWSWDEIEGRIKLQVTAPSPETRDKLQDAQRAQIEIPLGVQSRQGYMQEQGRNVDQVEADNQAYQDKFGSDGQALPLPGADGTAPGDAGGAGARTSPDATGGGGEGQPTEGQPNELRGTVGGLQAITSLQTAYTAGQIARDAGIASLKLLFGFTEEEAGSMLPLQPAEKRTDDGAGGDTADADGGMLPTSGLTESLQESVGLVDKVVTVHGKKGTFQRHQKVRADDDPAPGAGARTSLARDTIAADVIDSLPVTQRSPGLVGKVKQLAHAVNERILAFAIKHEKTIAAVGHVLDAALTTPDDLAKNPALFGKFAVSGNASGDAAQSALGVPASLVSRVIATAVVKGWAAMKAKLTKRSESLESLADDIGTATEIMVGLFNAAAEGLGLPDLDPDAVRAWLEQVTAKKGD